jgi:coenzyme F420-reducing hydrogenase alpha subunit
VSSALRISREVSRVAGESTLEVVVEGGRARASYSSVLSLRNFEALTRGRRPSEVPYIASRICGVCSHVHFWASSLALEQALGIEVGEDLAAIRDVCNRLQLVQNHVVHLGLLVLPDYVSRERFEEHARLTLATNSYLLKALNTLCGRLTNPVGYSLGRLLTPVEPRHLKAAADYLREARTYVAKLSEAVLGLELPELEDPAPSYVALSQAAAVTVPTGGPYSLTTPRGTVELSEDNYRSVLHEVHAEYSNSRKCVLMGEPFFVGARARLLATRGDLPVGILRTLATNPFSNNYAQAVEALAAVDLLVEVLGELSSRALRLGSSSGTPRGSGLGVVEAPRGLLVHYYRVGRDGRVEEADIVTPTVMNTYHLELSAATLARDLARRGLGEGEVARCVEALVRAYDPCIPCAVHVVIRR